MRASIRPKNSSTNLRATCVDSVRSAGAWNEPTFSERRMPQRDAAGRRRPRLVHVDEVQRRVQQHFLDRARDVHRRRRVDPLARRVEQQLAHAEDADAAVGIEQVLGMLPRGPDQPAATPAPARATGSARAAALCARVQRVPARPPRRTFRPRSRPRADAARPGRWRSVQPLRGRIVIGARRLRAVAAHDRQRTARCRAAGRASRSSRCARGRVRRRAGSACARSSRARRRG